MGAVYGFAAIAGALVPATAQSTGEAPKATEIGVTAGTEIHIAVVADVDGRAGAGVVQGRRGWREGRRHVP